MPPINFPEEIVGSTSNVTISEVIKFRTKLEMHQNPFRLISKQKHLQFTSRNQQKVTTSIIEFIFERFLIEHAINVNCE